jgi:hypothetical protein
MNYVTHFIHPEQRLGKPYIQLYCGKMVHETKDKYLATDNRDEVTCNSCIDRIDNPVRALKQYGDLHICRNHISMRPLPHTKLYASAQRIPASDSWNFIIYNSEMMMNETRTCHTSKQVVSTLLELVETEIATRHG